MARNRNSISVVAFLSVFIATTAAAILMQSSLKAQDSPFHGAPASAANDKNPYARKPAAAQAGADLYAHKCAPCHGVSGQGTANIPALAKGPVQSAADGAIFWFITDRKSTRL